jgi:predicted ribosomally synthesized peptide with SipW-like signal peptide
MKSKMAALFATVLIALAVVGFSYAWWTETLTISGTITTGELDVEFLGVASNDAGTANDPIMVSGTRQWATVHVATCEAEGSDGLDGDGDLSVITVTITNAYPCYYPQVTFKVKNGGTIPAKVASITTTAPSEVSVVLGGISMGQEIAAGASVDCTLDIHVTEAAHEGSSYTFTVTIEFKQFNA